MQNEFINYLIEWLLDDPKLAKLTVYSSNHEDWENKRLIIKPSEFFDDGVYLTPNSLVGKTREFLPSRGWIDGMEDNKLIPVLFGKAEVHEDDGKIILEADLIASTFYLVTRYEELINKVRDEHGRFPANQSWLMQNGMMHYPIVDEYSDYLRSLLGMEIKPRKLKKIYLTHDVDTVEFYRHFRGFVGGLCRGQIRQVWDATKGLEHDAAYTFPWIIEQDNKVRKAEQIYFIKAGESDKGHDYPMYNLKGADFQKLLFLLNDKRISLGLHCSYAAGEDSELIEDEKQRLQDALRKSITKTRYHYLRTLQSSDFQTLSDIGITDDFTMGYAQLAGFRMGTSRPIRWINPQTRQVSSLTLHPLTVMDCSLYAYMKLDIDDSYRYVKDLIDQSAYHGGEISLLWHNSTFSHNPLQKELYIKLIDYLTNC